MSNAFRLAKAGEIARNLVAIDRQRQRLPQRQCANTFGSRDRGQGTGRSSAHGVSRAAVAGHRHADDRRHGRRAGARSSIGPQWSFRHVEAEPERAEVWRNAQLVAETFAQHRQRLRRQGFGEVEIAGLVALELAARVFGHEIAHTCDRRMLAELRIAFQRNRGLRQPGAQAIRAVGNQVARSRVLRAVALDRRQVDRIGDRQQQQARQGRRPHEMEHDGARIGRFDPERRWLQLAELDLVRVAQGFELFGEGSRGRRRERAPEAGDDLRRIERFAVRPASARRADETSRPGRPMRFPIARPCRGSVHRLRLRRRALRRDRGARSRKRLPGTGARRASKAPDHCRDRACPRAATPRRRWRTASARAMARTHATRPDRGHGWDVTFHIECNEAGSTLRASRL